MYDIEKHQMAVGTVMLFYQAFYSLQEFLQPTEAVFQYREYLVAGFA
jgi:hypothetical protein